MKKEVIIQPGRVIGTPNPKMWGIFYEEINCAGDGGLYAELIRNRNFANSRLPEDTVYTNGKVRTRNGFERDFDVSDLLPGWKLSCSESSIAVMELTKDSPRNPECPEQLKLTVAKAGDGVKVVNNGYWGIPVKPQQYYGFIIIRGEGITEAELGICHSNGVEICSSKISICNEFAKIAYTLECPAENTNARFFVGAKQAGELYIDFVTLFPRDTDLERPYGMRKDIMKMLRDLKPGFLRFPGGCVVEGINLANAIHWKKTRGPIEDRPGHWDLWGYRATDGLGMLEFCQLAEDLDADLMYVVNCGMSCQGRMPEYADEAGVEEWMQTALDGIEYIYGDVSTPYGALRAADGHPEPFALKYVEIGNENGKEEYHVRYRKFYSVLKERYPELILIANELVPDGPMDMVDDHYYTAPQTFPAMIDAYEGDGVPVYVGEYACISGVGYGNLLGAVSEAAFMIRMENRSDRVRIASYAPLFCNDNLKGDEKWPVDLINFDGSHVFGIPSFDVQRLFSEYTVEEVYQTSHQPKRGESTELHVTAGKKGDCYVVKAANFGIEPITATFRIEDCELKARETWLLASEKPDDTNSLLYPDKVRAIAAKTLEEDGAVSMVLPPYSFGVLTMKAQ